MGQAPGGKERERVVLAAESPFDWMAAGYEKWHSTPKGKACIALEEEALGALLPPGRGGALLEIGCGTAFWFPFWRRTGYDPFGLDPSLPMLKQARAKGEGKVVQGRAEAPPFGEVRFQAVVFLTTLEFLPDPAEALARGARLLAPGGTLLAGVLHARSPMARSRKASGRPPWDRARFFTPSQVEVLLSPFGRPRIVPARPLPAEFPPQGAGPEEPFFFAAAVSPGSGPEEG